jgi:RNA polymerase sigma factor (sigma-70 family)
MASHSLSGPNVLPALMSDSERLEGLYVAHRDQVYRWALRYGAGDTAFAEDVTQEVFMRLMRALPKLQDTEQLGGWLYRVTANRCLSRLRRRRLTQAIVKSLGLHRAASDNSLEDQLEAREDLQHVLETLRGLPAKEGMVLTMLHLDGLSQSEIAQTLGLSRGYVSKLVARGTAAVKARGWEVAS